MSENQLMVQERPMYTPAEVKRQVQDIAQLMHDVLQEGTHYGKIPGTPKPTLYKPGAEKLALMFRLSPEYDLLPQSVFQDDFVCYRVRCTLRHQTSSMVIATGMGSCNSKENKYRSRSAADMDNTVFKMACKRALVAATLNATAASDIFTQDLEDDIPAPKQESRAPRTAEASTGPKSGSQEPAAPTQGSVAKDSPAQAEMSLAEITSYVEKTLGEASKKGLKGLEDQWKKIDGRLTPLLGKGKISTDEYEALAMRYEEAKQNLEGSAA